MGRPRIYNQNLVKKIAGKTKRSELKIVKSVSAFADRKSIPSEVALVVYAKRLGVPASTALRALSPHQQTQVDALLNSHDRTMTDSVRRPSAGKRYIKVAPQIEGEYLDPFLPVSVYGNLPSEGYAIMYVLENSIRQFIIRILSAVYGEAWWQELRKKKFLSELTNRVDLRKKNESGNWHHAKRGVHEIYYTDYSNLLQIIRAFGPDFLKYFRKGKEKNLLEKLAELTPSRNVIAHNNPISLDDLNRLKVHSKDWFKYMEYLHSQES